MNQKKSALQKNIEYSNKFIQRAGEFIIPEKIREILIKNEVKTLLDLGCGDGLFIGAIKREFPYIKVTGIDISPRRINSLKNKFPKDIFLCRDVCNTNLKKKFDFIYSSQVIEHVERDSDMVKEMQRLLSKDGVLFVSSVIKRPWGIYKYRNNGRFVLDPTHEKEYRDKKEFLDLFKKRFRLLSYEVYKTKRTLFGVSFAIPGFYQIEGFWKERIEN